MGPDYAHAEARKSPALDGKVERDSEGKEVRYPVILNAREKLIAWKVCLAFKVNSSKTKNRGLRLSGNLHLFLKTALFMCLLSFFRPLVV